MTTPSSRWTVLALTLLIGAATSPSATAQMQAATASPELQGLQDLKAIEAAARAELKLQAPESTAEIAPLDARIRLAACDRPVRAALPPNVTIGQRVNVRVSCSGGNINWSVTVPAEIWTEAPVVVAQRALPMGSPIGADDISIEVRKFPGTARCCSSQPDEVVGRLLRRTIQANNVIPLDAIEEAPAIRRGETVTVVSSLPGLEIRSSGVALGDARAGESVRIRNATTLKVFQARADTPGVVRVDR